MSVATDARGCAISGAHPSALLAYERALAAFQGWRGGIGAHLEQALQRAPDFVMAHVMQAYLAVSSRDPRRVLSARPVLARAASLRANELVVVEEIMPISARRIVNQAALKLKDEVIQPLLRAFARAIDPVNTHVEA